MIHTTKGTPAQLKTLVDEKTIQYYKLLQNLWRKKLDFLCKVGFFMQKSRVRLVQNFFM